MKRLFDIGASACALVVVAPVLIATAAAVRLSSGSPVLFRQTRIGRGGTSFELLKFRTMVVDAERIGPHFTNPGDPRITRVGAFLRRTSLDELPQLVNVLRGDMSVVGPRPDVPAQAADYTPGEWQQRHRVRPGITGLAQATLRSAASPEERRQLDLMYTEQHSLLMDMRIIGQTMQQVFSKGSH